MRTEQAIFDDLSQLCVSPGYAHVIAYLCFRDNMVSYDSELKPDDIEHMYSSTRLIRSEVSTLVGLLAKGDFDLTLPAPSVFQQYIERTESLLEELHHSLSADMFKGLDSKKISEKGFNPFTSGMALREPIFYGGESAYSFQYRDLSLKKYANDDEWLESNKGFSIRIARDVVLAIQKQQDENLKATLRGFRETPPEERTILPGYTFTAQEIAERSGIDERIVQNVLNAFSTPVDSKNIEFGTLNDFNATNAWPLLRANSKSYVLFQTYSLVEALYEGPFYWMGDDDRYVDRAMQNRGKFTEEFSRERLELVFGKENVHSNVTFNQSKSTTSSEIDVLVLFGNRAVIVQGKSKRLTLEARKGNDNKIKDDFKKSIQDAYDQGYACAKLLIEGDCKLTSANTKEVPGPRKLKEVYILCVISDHYPALSFQARQFLKFEMTEVIHPPFVMDVFTLDAITEMLQSPLRFLSYVNSRTKYHDRLHSAHELTILSYHLQCNLWLDDQYDMVQIGDDVSVGLDVAMAVRRDGVAGNPVPNGILTRFKSTALGRIVEEIEASPNAAVIDLGFLLLTLNEDTVNSVSKAIEKIAELARKDGKSHDVTIGIGSASTGLTIHCNDDPTFIAEARLREHCVARKYTEKADSWFGVCLHSQDASLNFGLNLTNKWERSAEMDAATRRFSEKPRTKNFYAFLAGKKIGRNERCPCGSGMKYKKCCMNK